MAAGQQAAQQRTAHGSLVRALPYAGLVIGLVVIGYFPVTEAYDAWLRARVAQQIDEAVSATSDEELAELLAQAEAYNLALIGLTGDIALDDIWPYEQQLSISGHDAAFGYVIIPDISLTMPIYHGTSDAVLSAGAGHLETSSLPIGGTGTHAVITAHSGLSGSRAFDDIDQLEVGDVFGVKVLGQLACYEVTSIETVLPDETSSLAIQADEDLCTLITCTPYGVNTHRLLVHGTRCEVPDGFESAISSPIASALASKRMVPFLIAFSLVALLLIVLAVWGVHRRHARAEAAMRMRLQPAPDAQADSGVHAADGSPPYEHGTQQGGSSPGGVGTNGTRSANGAVQERDRDSEHEETSW